MRFHSTVHPKLVTNGVNSLNSNLTSSNVEPKFTLFFASSIYFGLSSIPIQSRLSNLATFIVVPEPRKGSKTVSPIY